MVSKIPNCNCSGDPVFEQMRISFVYQVARDIRVTLETYNFCPAARQFYLKSLVVDLADHFENGQWLRDIADAVDADKLREKKHDGS